MAEPSKQTLTDQEQWLSIGEASELLGVSRDTLRRWEKVGKIKVYRSPTNRRTYKRSELEEVYRNKRSSTSNQKPEPASTINKKLPEISKPATISEPHQETVSPINSQPSSLQSDNQDIEKLAPEENIEIETLSPVIPTDNIQTEPTRAEDTPTESLTDPSISRPSLDSPISTVSEPLPPAILPTTPATQSRIITQPTTYSPQPSVSSTPSTTNNVLKVVTIVLAMILVLLGVTITILVLV